MRVFDEKVIYVLPLPQQVLPMAKMQSVVTQDQLDGLYSVKGDHFEIYAQPEKYTALADEVLTALEAKLGEK